MLRLVLKTLAAVFLAATIVIWVVTGSHAGWTKTGVAVTKTDEVTGIDYPQIENRFVAGLDFLALGATASAALLGVSLFIKPNKP